MEMKQRVAILGVTGFVGGGLPSLLVEKGMGVTGVSRSGAGVTASVDRWQTLDGLDFSGHDAVINLAGEPIDQRWTQSSRRRFYESRVGLTGRVVEALRRLPAGERPRVLVNASAVGIYGDRGDELIVENSLPGSGYLADLCGAWEEAAHEAESLGVRVVRVRIGIVLGRDGGAFKKLRPLFKLGVGGRLGSGRQWMPWIHLTDLRAALVHAVLSDSMAGAVNGTAPAPERNVDFTAKFAAAVHRPAIFPVPGFALKLGLGGFGSVLLAGQRAVPDALVADGFSFKFPKLDVALADLLS